MIAALFVAERGCYVGLDGVDPWPESRDARLYAGPWPVVAHPPCQRWGRYWSGCKASALAARARKDFVPVKRLSAEQRLATPPAFRDVLLSIARSARVAS